MWRFHPRRDPGREVIGRDAALRHRAAQPLGRDAVRQGSGLIVGWDAPGPPKSYAGPTIRDVVLLREYGTVDGVAELDDV